MIYTNTINSFYLCIDMGDMVYSLLYSKLLNVKKLFIDGGCNQVKFNWTSAKFILPLLQNQSYIDIAELFTGQAYDYNYGQHPNNEPVLVGTDLTRYHASKFGLINDKRIHEPWLTSIIADDALFKDKKIIINRTLRYHGNQQFYVDFLKFFHPKYLLFLGLAEEYDYFNKTFGLSNGQIDYIETPDILQLASIINTVPIFVGNQSLICAIATGLGKTAFIEYSPVAANYVFNRQNIHYF